MFLPLIAIVLIFVIVIGNILHKFAEIIINIFTSVVFDKFIAIEVDKNIDNNIDISTIYAKR